MQPHPQQHQRRPARAARATLEPLEGRLLCRIMINGEFVITPPGGAQAQETLHLHPQEGLTGLRTAEANSGGDQGPVVN